ncbi:MAG: undecaprenyl-phosphate glucose phosphotransferase [Pirellulaceae bacterium]|nr:undecaprenyl-phosphate glucose phosphotransferase [Planctomycetales bacterium]
MSQSHSRTIHVSRSIVHSLYRLADAIAIVAMLAVLVKISKTCTKQDFVLAGTSSMIAFAIVAEFCGLYRSWRGTLFLREVFIALAAWTMAMGMLLVAGVMFDINPGLTRKAFISWYVSAGFTIGAIRGLTRYFQALLRSRGVNTRGYAIVGANTLGVRLARNIHETPHMGLHLIGFYDDRPDERTVEIPQELGELRGNIGELVEMARSGDVSIIYIAFPMRAEERIRGVLDRLSDTTASVYIVPDFFVFELLHSRWSNIQGLPVVSVFENPLYGVDGLLKRCLDVALGIVLLAMLAIPMSIIALLVKATSKGPVFFRQRRYGLDGQEIPVWKFRTMTVCEDGDVVTQATRGDNRITTVGGFLRKTSLDELPQLFNVLKGDMSLVGPRPHATAHNELFRKQIPGYMLRHKVKPGITGLAQVNGWRGETDTLEKMERRIECDHQYIREWSIWMDLKILLRTLSVVFSTKNAY